MVKESKMVSERLQLAATKGLLRYGICEPSTPATNSLHFFGETQLGSGLKCDGDHNLQADTCLPS